MGVEWTVLQELNGGKTQVMYQGELVWPGVWWHLYAETAGDISDDS